MNWAGSENQTTVPAPGQGFWGREALLADVRARLLERRGFAISTLNLDHAVKLRASAVFRAAYAAHTHVTADGQPVVWLERLSGGRAELVTGADLVVPLIEVAVSTGTPVTIVGSTDAILRDSADVLCRHAPSLEIRARIAPPASFDPHSEVADEIVREVSESGAGLCLLALGAPKQEILGARLHRELPSLGVASVGAALDFLAGAQRRAPRLVQSMAMEWLWRLGHDPVRLSGRYVRCAALLPSMGARALGARLSQPGPRSEGA